MYGRTILKKRIGDGQNTVFYYVSAAVTVDQHQKLNSSVGV